MSKYRADRAREKRKLVARETYALATKLATDTPAYVAGAISQTRLFDVTTLCTAKLPLLPTAAPAPDSKTPTADPATDTKTPATGPGNDTNTPAASPATDANTPNVAIQTNVESNEKTSNLGTAPYIKSNQTTIGKYSFPSNITTTPEQSAPAHAHFLAQLKIQLDSRHHIFLPTN